MPVGTRRRWTDAHRAARRLAAAVMLRQWQASAAAHIEDSPEGHIAALLDAVERTGLRLHLPGPPRAYPLADRLDQALAALDLLIAAAEHAAALGRGQADIRTHQRGGDPVAGRITQQLRYPDDPDSPPAGPPHIADVEAERLRKLRQAADNWFGYDLARLQRALSENLNRDTPGVSAGQGASIDKPK
jgi:hypothetical protein